MKNRYFALLLGLLLAVPYVLCAEPDPTRYPVSVQAMGDKGHVQGIAYDAEKGFMYYSFTTCFLKVNRMGDLVASIDRVQGHLGAMCFNPSDRKVYASLECKDDVIGAHLSTFAKGRSLFYIAVIDVDKLDRLGMDPEGEDYFRVAALKEVADDYSANVEVGGKTLQHRYGCSGIDGITIAPEPGKAGSKPFLYVAYGIYGENDRQDNDYQALLRYDLASVDKTAVKVKFGSFSTKGPKKSLSRYFVFTGNTTYGVQNMAYDPYKDIILLAVYKGKKEEYPNWSHYAVDWTQKPVKEQLKGVPYDTSKHLCLKLAQMGGEHSSGIRGWNYRWGATGLCSLGEGLWFVSENGKDSESGRQKSDVRLCRWAESDDVLFEYSL